MSLNSPALWQQLAALVRLSLRRFWCQALPKDDSLLGLLADEAHQLLGGREQADADSLFNQLHSQWSDLPDEPISTCIQDLELSLADALLFALLGEMERSHLLSLVVHQLQSPSQQPRPTAHLIEAWLQTLPNQQQLSTLNWLDHSLLRHAFVGWSDHGPMPLRQLSTPAPVWALMTGQLDCWPGCSLLTDADITLLPESVQAQLPTLARMLSQHHARGLVLRGHPGSGRGLLTAALAQHLQLRAMVVDDEMWQNTPALVSAVRYGRWLPVVAPAVGPGEILSRPMPGFGHPMVFHIGTDGALDAANLLDLKIPLPQQEQRKRLWLAALPATDGAPDIARRASNALLSGPNIQRLASNAALLAEQNGERTSHDFIVQARAQLGAEQLRLLAEPDTRLVSRAAIVLPPLVESELDRLTSRAEQRETVWQGLGQTLSNTRTAGVRALFVGDSGTGKTLAASYLATRLGSPLYRVDLASVMNKYIGESEKNLSAVLDMAAAYDVVLLFDEADSLFGKRSEGKETGERFANMLTHFLLTRIENHPGIVVLTSNNRERIDAAFTRRLDVIVEFPVPGFEERKQLWQSHLGQRGPGDEVYQLLGSYCDFTGGQLRNVVLTAAAQAGNNPITAADLLVGLNAEYRKLGREVPGKLNQLMHI